MQPAPVGPKTRAEVQGEPCGVGPPSFHVVLTLRCAMTSCCERPCIDGSSVLPTFGALTENKVIG